ncbi:MAG: tyrosine-type recombinase/integrase family protein [Microbacterium sp.]|nr:tyrosine-type recombinase/integrase family protein [Microbacterium sp.]
MGSRRSRGTGTIFRDKRGYWTVALPLATKDGKRQRSVKRFRDRESAVAHLLDFERSRAGTDLPRANDYPSGVGKTTVGEWFEYWLTECVYPQLRPRTADGYRSAVTTHIVPSLGYSTPLAAIRASDIRRMQHAVREGRSPTTVRNVHTIAARAFDVAVREEEISRNPVRLVEQPRPARPDLDVPTTSEVRHLTFSPVHAAVRLLGSRLTESVPTSTSVGRCRLSGEENRAVRLPHQTLTTGICTAGSFSRDRSRKPVGGSCPSSALFER